MNTIMMFIRTEGHVPFGLWEEIAKLDGVEMVYHIGGHYTLPESYPDLVVIAASETAGRIGKKVQAMEGIESTYQVTVDHSQPHIITPADIPGPVPSPARLKAAPAPVITTEDIPGYVRSPSMRPAVVHHDFSSQAGLASMAGADNFGFGSGLTDMATLAD